MPAERSESDQRAIKEIKEELKDRLMRTGYQAAIKKESLEVLNIVDREIARRAREDAEAKRLMTIPGIGPITATALAAFSSRCL